MRFPKQGVTGGAIVFSIAGGFVGWMAVIASGAVLMAAFSCECDSGPIIVMLVGAGAGVLVGGIFGGLFGSFVEVVGLYLRSSLRK